MLKEKTYEFEARMAKADLPSIFIDTFVYYYEQLVEGRTGLIPEADIEPVAELENAESFSQFYDEIGETVLGQTAVIKLNGGLGTSMGLRDAKSLLPVKNNLTFLDIIARQVIAADVPLLLMNSFNTDAGSLDTLNAYPELARRDLPLRFLQHKEPKIRQSDLKPVSWPQNPELEWCPPGHGDIYTALITSGALDALLAAGYKYAFVSNVDNLGAVIDLAILGYFADNQFPFMMEVADRTSMDRKGGHLARRREDGQFILRESAQCPPEAQEMFQDITRYKYFNTNNLWLNLQTLQDVMESRNYRLGLPLIRNLKTVDPRDPDSTPVYQLETAMGSAIGVFDGAQAIRVPRTRFSPVKTTNDLLAVRSDAFEMTPEYRVAPRNHQLTVTLDPEYYQFVGQLDQRFAHGAPSLIDCQRLTVEGDFSFGKDVVCRGEVHLINRTERQVQIEDGAVLNGRIEF